MKSTHETSKGATLAIQEKLISEWTAQEYKDAFLNAALDCIVTMDEAGTITEWNRAAEKVFGYKPDDAIGKKLAELLIPLRYREKHARGLARYLATGEKVILDQRIELPALRSNGEEFPVELTVTHLKFGNESLFTGFMRDLSERKKLEQTKAAFLANVSHELRTPLHLILGPAADALQDKEQPLPSRQQARLTLIHSNALRLLKLANSVLDFSKIKAGQLQGRYEPVDLTVFTAELIETFRAAIEKAGLTLQVTLTPLGEPAYVDKDMWERMLFNLLSNALKYTLTGGITITLNAQAGKAILRVTDTGIGIPEAELGNVFKRFHQVGSAQGRSLRGTGIGLALTQEFIKLHGGSIQVESQLAKGSAFTLILPLGRAHLPAQQVSETLLPSSGAPFWESAFVDEAMRWLPEEMSQEKKGERLGKAQPVTPRLSMLGPGPLKETHVKEKILLIEDNADMRGYLNHLLVPYWEMELAENGKAALAAILKEKPNLILTDVMMPEMNGVELMKALRSDPKTADIPIILISAQADGDALAGGLEQGADDYLIKPFSARELIARVKTQLELRQMRDHLEKKVQQQALELQLFSAVSPVGIFHCNAAGEVSYVSSRACDISGQTEEHLKGSGWIKMVSPEDQGRITALWQKTVEEKAERFKAEFRCLRHDKAVVWTVNEATAEKDAAGQIKGYVHAITDITEWKDLEKSRFDAIHQAEEQYRQRAQDAEAYRTRQEQFIDTMCHELRNPLNGIYGNVTLLDISLSELEKLLEATGSDRLHEGVRQEILKHIRQSKGSIRAIDTCARHQKVITNDVLNLSKLEAGKVELNLTDFDPKKVVQDAVDMLDAEVTRKKIQLYVELLHNDIRVNGDRDRLAQVLLNLLTNAIKFTPEKGKIWVRMSSQEETEENNTILKFSVKDTGIGMTEAEKVKLFDRFMQATRATYSEYGGSGLGLAISKNLVELMGGKIEVESKKDAGSKFMFTVKCKNVPIPSKKLSPVSLFFEPSLAPTQGGGKRILIVEDNLINQKLLKRILEKSGHQCEIANNGKEAYELAEKGPYDVILMDIEMPVMDGFEATKAIRQREATEGKAPTPIIGLSGNAREEHQAKAISAGMNDYLTKPYERAQLLEKIASYTRPTLSSPLHL